MKAIIPTTIFNSRVIAAVAALLIVMAPARSATVTPSAAAGTTSNWLQNWAGATVSDGTYLLPAASVPDSAVINQNRTIQVGAPVSITAGPVYVNNTTGSATPNAFLEINPGGLLVCGAITIAQNTDPGVLTIQGGYLTTNAAVKVGASGAFNLTSGSFTNNGTGPRTIFTDTNGAGGEVNISGGTFTAKGAAATDALYIYADAISISGGTIDMGGGQVIPADTTTITVSGDEAVITMDRLNINSATRAATIRFIFDETGVSPVNCGGFLNLANSKLVIDGSAYAGGPAVFDLFITPNLVTASSNVTVTGFGTEGVDYTLTQDAVGEFVRIEVTNYQGARDTVAALGTLTTAPAIWTGDTVPGTPATLAAGDLKAIYYDALDYQGNPTRVYAWVGIPAGASAGNPVPAVVLAHGGGGTAFKDWVQKWNARGYAAIAMALEGQTDTVATQQQIDAGLAVGSWLKHSMPGPARDGIYGDSDVALTDQWMYHAVADVILANSLLRSLPEVDTGRVGLMGISWGGVITSTVIGIDSRFAFAIPTYGCGHLYDVPNQYGTALAGNILYREVWDPMVRIDQATLPVFWLSWPQESNFSLDSQAYTYLAAPGPRMVALVPGMQHGHSAAWNRPESYDYADSIVAADSQWCSQVSASRTGDSVQVVFASSRALNSATLLCTTGTGFTGGLVWQELPVGSLVEGPAGTWTVSATLPAGATAWFVNVKAQGSDIDADDSGTTDLYGYVDENVVVTSDYSEIIDVTVDYPAGLSIDHPLTEAVSTAYLAFQFTGPTNVEIVAVQFSGESHPGALSFMEPLPWVAWSPAPALNFLPITFDNTVAGLSALQTATATLTLIWEDQLDGTTDQLQVPVTVTARTPATVTYSATSAWSSQEVYSFDSVVIDSGAVVTLDQDDAAATVTVRDGSLQMSQGRTLLVNETLVVNAAGAINLTSGTMSPNVETVLLDGTLTVNGGSFSRAVAGLTPEFTGSGTLALVSGDFSLTGGGATNLTTLGVSTEVSGGAFTIQGSTNLAGTLTVAGDDATISMDRIHGATSGTFRFVLGQTGVSPVGVAYFANLLGASLAVDGAGYEGGPASMVLIDSTNLNGLLSPARISISGLTGKGLEAQVIQDQTDGRDWVQLVLAFNDYGLWADGYGLGGADAFAGADPDRDGMDNSLEYALGGDPTTGADAAILPQIVPGGAAGEWEFRYLRRRDAAARGLTYIVERSDSLLPGGWSTAGISETGSTIIDEHFVLVTLAVPAAGAVFVRLSVDLVD